MNSTQAHISLLGFRVTDRVTGMSGVVTSISFDLYGCVQATVHPGLTPEGKPADQHWFDVARLEVTSADRVMPLPNFESGPVAEGLKGPAEKPSISKT